MHRPMLAAIMLSWLSAPAATGETKPRVDAYGEPLPDGAISRWGSTLLSNCGQLGGLAFSPDGKWVASGGGGGVTHIFAAKSGKLIRDLKAPINGWGPLAFSPDGKTLAASAGGKLVCLWQPDTGKLLHRLSGPDQMVRSITFSRDNKLVAAGGGDGSIFLWDVATGKTLHVLKGHAGAPQGLAFSPDNTTLASTGHDGTTRLWDVATGQQASSFGVNPYTNTAIAYADAGKTLITAQGQGTGQGCLRYWDVQAGKVLREVATHKGGILCMALSADGKVLATGGYDRIVRFWDAANGVELGQSPVQPGWVHHVALSPDGGTVAWGTYYGYRVRIGQVRGLPKNFEFKQLLPRGGHESGVGFLAFTADGKKVLSTSSDNDAILWDRHSGKELMRVHTGNLAALSPDGKLMALADVNDRSKGILIFDTTRSKDVRYLPTTEQTFSLALSANNRILAVGRMDGTIDMVELATGMPRVRLSGPRDWSLKIELSPDGLLLAEATGKFIRLWDTVTGKELVRLPYAMVNRAMTFSRDGKMLAFGLYVDKAVVLWDVPKGKEIRRFEGRVHNLAFTPDNQTLVAAGTDETIRLWDVGTGKVRHDFKGHAGWVSTVAVSPDGRTLASGGIDTTVLMWDMERFVRGKPVQFARKSVKEILARYFEFPPRGEWPMWWADLARADAAKAHVAIWGLASEPKESLPVMKKWLSEVSAVSIDALIADLSSDTFKVRENATLRLIELGQIAEFALRDAQKANPGPEQRARIERILSRTKSAAAGTNDGLRFMRALEVLELIDTAESRAILNMVAKKAPTAQFAQDARDALERLERSK